MRIEEHKKGQTVKLFYRVYEKEYWETTITDSIEKNPHGHILCKPIQKNGKNVYFNHPYLIAEIKDPETNRIFRYNIEKNGYLTFNDVTYLALLTKEDAKPYNRRKEYRIPYVQEAQIKFGSNASKQNCYINDISPTGMCISIEKNRSYQKLIGELIQLSFYIEKENITYKISGKIVRAIENENNFNLLNLGIRLDSDCVTGKWISFITKEQRRQLANR